MAPLVFFTPGGMGPIATTVDRKLLSSLVAEKHGSSYRLHPLQLRPLQVEFFTVVTCNCVYLRLEVVITIDQLASLLESLTCPASSRISV